MPCKCVIAIDGPAGTGKSSAGKLLAARLGLSFLGTGEMYRALGYKVFAAGIDMTDDAAVTALAQKINFTFERQADASLKMFVDGEFLGPKLQSEEAGSAASKTSALPNARLVLTEKQRAMAAKGGIILEGRDIGTVVCPDADFKFFITASAPVRAERRVKQLEESGQKADYAAILKSIEERDHRDSTRAAAPLKPAADAVIVDTSDITLEQVVEKLAAIVGKECA